MVRPLLHLTELSEVWLVPRKITYPATRVVDVVVVGPDATVLVAGATARHATGAAVPMALACAGPVAGAPRP